MGKIIGIKQNELVGRYFKPDAREFIVTWNDKTHVRATPMDCPSGLTSMQFSLRYVIDCGHYAEPTTRQTRGRIL